MKKTKKKLVIGAVILTAALALTGCKGRQAEEEASIKNSDLFQTMETVDLKGNKVDSDVFTKNKLTLVNVWNKGCTPCIEELPILDKINKEYEGQGVAIKGLYFGFGEDLSTEERTQVEQILEEGQVEYQQLLTSKEMADSEILSNLLGFPTTYFVNEKGEIIHSISGSNDYEGWKLAIEQALEEGA